MTVEEAVQRHCDEIERCNQRGGRILSIVNLIKAGTISRDLAAYALAAISRGDSFLVGALPGGAGKTTVMGGLLNFVPTDVMLVPADSLPTIEQGQQNPQPRLCYICHEIGPGPYYAYLWDRELRAYFELFNAGHMLATNLHADTLDGAYRQICTENGVAENLFWRMNLMFFLSAQRTAAGVIRRVEEAWHSDGTCPHRQIYPASAKGDLENTGLVPEFALKQARETIDHLLTQKPHEIQDVRRYLLSLEL